MYCSGFGTEIRQGINYCNLCGKRTAEEAKATAISPGTATAIGYIGGFAFIAYIFVVIATLRLGVSPDDLLKITFLYFAALFGICFALLYFSRNNTIPDSRRDLGENSTAKQEYFKPTVTAQLNEPREPAIGSITEETTRTLDKVPVRRY